MGDLWSFDWQDGIFNTDHHLPWAGCASFWAELAKTEEELAMPLMPQPDLEGNIYCCDTVSSDMSTHNNNGYGITKLDMECTTSLDTTTTTTTTTTTSLGCWKTSYSPCTLDDLHIADICKTPSLEEAQMSCHEVDFPEKEWQSWAMEGFSKDGIGKCSNTDNTLPSTTHLISSQCPPYLGMMINNTIAKEDQSSPSLCNYKKKLIYANTMPVAYPFSLLKPSKVEGHVTLKDINHRIQTKSNNYNGNDPPISLTKPCKKRAANSNSHDGNDLPCYRRKGHLSCDLVNKSIVGLTRVHTEGNGCITIIRTKK